MPLYSYCCDVCQHTDLELRKMADATPVGECVACPKCGAATYRRMLDVPHTDLRDFHTPIEMFSIAMEDPQEIRAFASRCPDVAISDNPEDELFGVPIARNRKAKLQALAAAGFEERN